jgi:gas vesicle protein
MKNTGKVIAGVAAGLAAGTIIGVLIAPDKGSKTINKIGDDSKKLAGGLINKGREKLVDLKDNITDKITDIKSNLTESALKKINTLKDNTNC